MMLKSAEANAQKAAQSKVDELRRAEANAQRAAQSKVDELQTMEKMIPHVVSTNKEEKTAALFLIARLSSPEVARFYAEQFDGIRYLQAEAQKTKSSTQEKATESLVRISAPEATADELLSAVKALGPLFAGKEKGLVQGRTYFIPASAILGTRIFGKILGRRPLSLRQPEEGSRPCRKRATQLS